MATTQRQSDESDDLDIIHMNDETHVKDDEHMVAEYDDESFSILMFGWQNDAGVHVSVFFDDVAHRDGVVSFSRDGAHGTSIPEERISDDLIAYLVT